MKIECNRGFGKVENPLDGSELAVETPIDGDTALLNALKEEYGEHTFEAVEPHPNGDEDTEEYTCGVNDCSRSVDSPEETCWQH